MLGVLKTFTKSSDKLDAKMDIGKFISSLATSDDSFSNVNEENTILFQVKFLGWKIKEATWARYNIKVTAWPSFKWLFCECFADK